MRREGVSRRRRGTTGPKGLSVTRGLAARAFPTAGTTSLREALDPRRHSPGNVGETSALRLVLGVAALGTMSLPPDAGGTRRSLATPDLTGRGSPRSLPRPRIGRDHPVNLSISITGGKETNRDVLSSGERSGHSPSPNLGILRDPANCSLRHGPRGGHGRLSRLEGWLPQRATVPYVAPASSRRGDRVPESGRSKVQP
jgi:hypothetical protein